MSDLTKLFGRIYGEIGDQNKDLILNTKGEIKVRVGKKFFNLFKNGKIEGADSTSISYTEDISLESSDGFYIDQEGSVYLIYGNSTYTLKGDNLLEYVSYNEEQNVNRDLQYLALKNIGLIFPTLEDASGITNGIVYIEEEKALYVVIDGELKNFISESGLINKLVISDGSQTLTINPTSISGLADINLILSFSPNGIVVDRIDNSDGSFSVYLENGTSVLQVGRIEKDTDKDISNLCEIYVDPADENNLVDGYPGYSYLGTGYDERLLNYYYLEYYDNNISYRCIMLYSEKETEIDGETIINAKFKGEAYNKTLTIEGTVDESGYFYTTSFSS